MDCSIKEVHIESMRFWQDAEASCRYTFRFSGLPADCPMDSIGLHDNGGHKLERMLAQALEPIRGS